MTTCQACRRSVAADSHEMADRIGFICFYDAVWRPARMAGAIVALNRLPTDKRKGYGIMAKLAA
ncbi:hypothetical protein [Burkholderia ubonensis]|uniref:hypothetical protein n=1 Tax=Burkholderia ubonensis TaxID=101571 RepID=UPI00075E76EB|nr:hypothetical protein [Burkholderia ubonensis]